MGEVVKVSETVYQGQRTHGYEMSRFGHFLTSLANHEVNHNEIMGGTFLQLVGAQFEIDSNAYQDQLDKLLSTYITPMRYQAGKVNSIKLVMQNREDAIEEVQKANASVHRNKERFAAARASSGAAAAAIAADHKVEMAEKRMITAREQVEFIARNLTTEAHRFEQDKTDEFRRALLSLAHIQVEYRVQVVQIIFQIFILHT